MKIVLKWEKLQITLEAIPELNPEMGSELDLITLVHSNLEETEKLGYGKPKAELYIRGKKAVLRSLSKQNEES